MLNSSDLDKFILERNQKISEARKEINYKQQRLKLEYSPIGADEKENSNVSNRTSFQVKKKEAGCNEKQTSTPLQSNRQMPVLPPVEILHDTNASSVVETPKSFRRRKPPKELVLVNCRELEKQRLASAMAATAGTAVLGCQVSPQLTHRTRLAVSNSMPVVSPRQLEIDRLAKLFEGSEESCLRNSRIVVDEYPKTPDTNERIPSILKTPDHLSDQSTTHQARLKVRNPRVEPQISYCSHDMVCLKDSATQTDDEPPNPGLLEPDDYRVMRGGLSLPTSPEYSDRSRSPMKSPRVGKPTSEMYIRQYQYREELKKQIEERQKLEAERKERERLEEEAIERRVREQQEKLRRQYEIEEQERLDYIMRRHIQDDVLRQRLADIQQHDTREKPAGGKERMRPVTVTHCSKEDSNQVRAAEPGDPVCQLIESAENMLKAPLLADPACSAPLPPPLPPSPRLETHSVAGRRQADASPCRRQPVLKAVSPCVSVKPRSNNAQILDNKWQVPAVERSYIQPRSVLGNHADQVHSSPDNVLTQLSSFRRQLQMEHFRLNERMQQQSKRRSP
ncbi:inner centromere protein-like isoform X8 [Nilaparvata lugens]|uniref:inner centromere protein-like isoform X8 n=1 Tax=Nilaparvata lugens TaxID=108931 RepID=UPI00193CA875|nr:inner centromere protein-like isoform X8 [Nilaparvata lugens]